MTGPSQPRPGGRFQVSREDMAMMQSALTRAEELAASGSVTAAAEAQRIKQDIARSDVVPAFPPPASAPSAGRSVPLGTITISITPTNPGLVARVPVSEITADVLTRVVEGGLDPRAWTVTTHIEGSA